MSNTSVMKFVGVSTKASFVNRVFDAWCDCLGISAKLLGTDLAIGAADNAYRNIVQSIRKNECIKGALVTTHKARMYECTRDLFDEVGGDAQKLHEIGAIFRVNGRLMCEATDPPAVQLALERIMQISKNTHWDDVVILGGGGAGLALAYVLVSGLSFVPSKVTIVERAASRIIKLNDVTKGFNHTCEFVLKHNPVGVSDKIVQDTRRPALIVNATGMGKDTVGSPLSCECDFPRGSVLWDFNYRGKLSFLDDAKPRAKQLELSVVDGWHYFICGWYQVMTRVFGIARKQDLLSAFEFAAESQRELT